MKKLLSSFPKILLIVVGLINFNYSAFAQQPAKKKNITYSAEAELAYAQVCADLKAEKDIFNCSPTLWLQQICDNAVEQGYPKSTPGQMLDVILDPKQTSLKWLTPDQVINSYLMSGGFTDCLAKENGWYVCVGDCILFRLGPTNCLNPCKSKNTGTGRYPKREQPIPPAPPITVGPAKVTNTDVGPNVTVTQAQAPQNVVSNSYNTYNFGSTTVSAVPQLMPVYWPQQQQVNVYQQQGTVAPPISNQPTCPNGQQGYWYTYPDGQRQWLCPSSGTGIAPGTAPGTNGIGIHPGAPVNTGGVITNPGAGTNGIGITPGG